MELLTPDLSAQSLALQSESIAWMGPSVTAGFNARYGIVSSLSTSIYASQIPRSTPIPPFRMSFDHLLEFLLYCAGQMVEINYDQSRQNP
jgi:hypothetical protein